MYMCKIFIHYSMMELRPRARARCDVSLKRDLRISSYRGLALNCSKQATSRTRKIPTKMQSGLTCFVDMRLNPSPQLCQILPRQPEERAKRFDPLKMQEEKNKARCCGLFGAVPRLQDDLHGVLVIMLSGLSL